MMNTLIVWNPIENLDVLGKMDADNLVKIIVSSREWDNLPNKLQFNNCYLLAEITWDNRPRTQFYGFKILEELRLKHQVLFPVFICSIHPLSFFLGKGGVFQIFRTPGHYFIPLPNDVFQYKHDKKAIELTPNLLKDISFHYFSIKGWVDEIIHSLKGKVTGDLNQEVIIHFGEISKVVPELNQVKLHTLRNDLSKALETSTSPGVSAAIIAIYKTQILHLLPQYEDADIQEESGSPHQYVLCIDDEESLLKTLSTELKERGIHCFTAQSGEAAFDILKTDFEGRLTCKKTGKVLPANSITVVVTDLRFVDKAGNWNFWQGWDIIEHIYSELQNLVAFFVLTSKKGTIVRKLQEGRKFNILMFSKEDVLVDNKLGHNPGDTNLSGLNIFAQRIQEEGDKISKALIDKPSGEYWRTVWKNKINFPMQDYYRTHRMRADYEEKERWIGDCALKFIEAAERLKSRAKRHNANIENLGFDYNFKAGLSEPPQDEKSMEKFYIKLIGRRIAIGLKLKGWNEGEITAVLKTRSLDEEGEKDRQLFTYFAMSSVIQSDLSNHLLVEEYKWVYATLGVSLKASERDFFSRIEQRIIAFQEKLIQRNILNEGFAQTRIGISNTYQAKALLKQVQECAGFYKMKSDMRRIFEPIYQDQKIRKDLLQYGLFDDIKFMATVQGL